jgi:hypothetical protein
MPASEMLGHFLDSATRALITSSADMGGKLTSLGKVLAEVPCFELSTPEGAPHLAASELRRILDRVSRKEPGVAAIAGRMT